MGALTLSDRAVRCGAAPTRMCGHLRVLGPVSVAGAAGLCWGSELAALAFVPVVYLAWWRAQSRVEATLVGATYHAVAARSLARGAVQYFGMSYLAGAGVVAGAALIVGVVWGVCWTPPASSTPWWSAWGRVVSLVVITTVPPLGALAIPTPLAAAGVWFPGGGIAGLVAVTLVAAAMRTRVAAPCALMLCAFVRTFWVVEFAETDAHIATIDFAHELGPLEDFGMQARIALQTIDALSAETDPIVVAPEGVGGLWLDPPQHAWSSLAERLRARGQSALVGATRARGSALEASIVVLGATAGVYRQRVPMPVAMWRPWRNDGAFLPNWLGATTLVVGGRRLGLLVCWEIGAPWSVLGSVFSNADALVGVANLQWLRGTSAEAAEQQMLTSWGALFDLPTVFAVNR